MATLRDITVTTGDWQDIEILIGTPFIAGVEYRFQNKSESQLILAEMTTDNNSGVLVGTNQIIRRGGATPAGTKLYAKTIGGNAVVAVFTD